MTKEEFLRTYAVNRRHSDCKKWDALVQLFGTEDLLPLWIADIDFKVPDAVIKALKTRIDHGAFGYTLIPTGYKEAVNGWLKRRHNYTVDPQHMRLSGGVVTAFYNAITAFTNEGDSILILQPVYPPFHSAPDDTHRQLVTSDLVQDAQGRYTMDFADIENKITTQKVKMLIFCNPHNPVGRVWTKEELATLFAICERHDVLIISDEIHQDFIYGEHQFTPALTINEGQYKDRIISLFSTSKSFNLASLPIAHVVIPNQKLRRTYDKYIASIDKNPLSILNLVATQAAYEEGDEWLDALKEVIYSNYELFRNRLLEAAPKLVISPLEGTYLGWVDFSAYIGHTNATSFLRDTCKLGLNYGHLFSSKSISFARFNLGTTPEIINEAVDRIIKGLQSLQK